MKKPVKKFGGGMMSAAKRAAPMPVKKAAPVGTTGSRLPVTPPPGVRASPGMPTPPARMISPGPSPATGTVGTIGGRLPVTPPPGGGPATGMPTPPARMISPGPSPATNTVGTIGGRLPVAPPPGVGIGMKKGGVVKAKKKPVWDAPRPKDLGKPKKLSTKATSSAKAMAKKAGRPYPNLVDNMRAARKK